eukprot:m.1201250 g.1201250  ORF g.1201250 m.1201250 type:complete len:80 (+) comp24574_c0_seq68:2357-2596(+)
MRCWTLATEQLDVIQGGWPAADGTAQVIDIKRIHDPLVLRAPGSLAVRHKHRCCARKHTSVVDAPASNDLEDLRLKRNR